MRQFQEIIRRCEKAMLDACRRYNASSGREQGSMKLGREGRMAFEFVDCMFGPEKELYAMEEFMTAAHEWCHRFELQCKELVNKSKTPRESLDDLREPRPPPHFPTVSS